MNVLRHDSQLLKGVLTMLLLHFIGERESYGYELVERVHSLGLTEVPDGSIYPALNRLERDGQVTSYLVRSSAGPARKYYRLSDSGHQMLDERRRAWLALVELLTPLFAGEPVNRTETHDEASSDRPDTVATRLEVAPSWTVRTSTPRDPA